MHDWRLVGNAKWCRKRFHFRLPAAPLHGPDLPPGPQQAAPKLEQHRQGPKGSRDERIVRKEAGLLG